MSIDKLNELLDEFESGACYLKFQEDAGTQHDIESAQRNLKETREELLAIIDKPECDHDFQPVYNKGQPQAYRFDFDMPSSQIVEILEATKAKTFAGCYCKKCGKIINAEIKK